MMNEEEIESLAERVVAKYSTSIPIDLLEIANKINVKILTESYEDCFFGFICYRGKEFYILLNLDELKDINYSKARYTFAHELGHYFIRNHRNVIKKGESFAFLGKTSNITDKNIFETEAEQFAASLLMPKIQFIEYFNNSKENGFEAVISLKNHFNVSITSTVIRFNKLNLTPCITVSWSDKGVKGKGVSKKFLDLLGNNYSIDIKLNPDRPKFEEKKVLHESSGIVFSRLITPLSSWVYDVPRDISNQIFLIEETLYHTYGNLTMLRLIDCQIIR